MVSRNEDAEKLMRAIQKQEAQLAQQDPEKKCYHLCIVNIVIDKMYCLKGNWNEGISRILKSLEPYDKKLGADTWFHAKPSLLRDTDREGRQADGSDQGFVDRGDYAVPWGRHHSPRFWWGRGCPQTRSIPRIMKTDEDLPASLEVR